MKINLATAARAAPLIALLSAACVSQSAYEQQGQQLEEARAEAAAQQAQIAKMQQEQKWVVAGDLLFPEGGYQLGPNAQAALGEYVPRLQNLQNAKVVVYGYTDNQPVGPALQRAGISQQHRPVVAPGRQCRGLFPLARRQPRHPVGQGVRRHPSRRLQRHAAGAGAEPPHRDRAGGPGRLTTGLAC